MKNKAVSSEFLIILFGKIIVLALTIIGMKFTTSLIEPNVYGRFSLFLTVTTFGELMFGILGQGVGRFYFEAKQKNEYNILRELTIGLIKNISLFLIFTIPISWYFFDSWLIAILILIFSILTGFIGLLSGLQNAERHRIIVVIHEIADKILKFGGLIIVGILIPNSDKMMLIAYTIAALIIFCSQWYFYRENIEKVLIKQSIMKDDTVAENRYLKNIYYYSYPFIIWTVFSWVQNGSDRWVLSKYMSTTEVGLYQVLNQYGFQLVSIGVGMIVSLISPILFNRAASKHDRIAIANTIKLNIKISYILGIFLFFLFVFSLLFHKLIFHVLVGESYRHISYLFPIILLGGGFFGIGQLLANNFMINFNPSKIIIPKIISSVLNIGLYIILVQKFGLSGVILSIVLSQFLYMIWLYVLSQNFILNHDLLLVKK